jgi:hypothetical protein
LFALRRDLQIGILRAARHAVHGLEKSAVNDTSAEILVSALPLTIRIEVKTVEAMINIACADRHGPSELCQDCLDLRRYARERLEKCRFGAAKPTCAACPVHCYSPAMRERIRAVMRQAGPRMFFSHPWLTLIHYWKQKSRHLQGLPPP